MIPAYAIDAIDMAAAHEDAIREDMARAYADHAREAGEAHRIASMRLHTLLDALPTIYHRRMHALLAEATDELRTGTNAWGEEACSARRTILDARQAISHWQAAHPIGAWGMRA